MRLKLRLKDEKDPWKVVGSSWTGEGQSRYMGQEDPVTAFEHSGTKRGTICISS
jgi:hypothetical protein